MGTVFLAEAPGGRLVAVKVIRPEYAHEPEFRARFRSEVNRARQVPPFCTAEVLDADPDVPYLVVEYVDGPSLSDVVAENGPLTGGNLHGVAVGVATALAAIHGAGVIHRDLKPRNVLFALGTPKVIDFGIARPLEPTSFHTRAEEVVGTLAYMAPERLDTADRPLTPAVDVFAWGAVVAYAGAGRTPFGGDTPAVTAARILTQPPRVGDLPPYLAELVTAALEKDPANRPTAPELLDRLLVPGAPAPLPAQLRREAEAAAKQPRPSRRRWVAVAAATATLVAAGAGLVFRQLNDPQPAAPAVDSKPPVVAGPSIFDSLERSAFFEPSTGDDGSCSHQRGLRVRSTDSMMCGLYSRTVFPAAQSVEVRATLSTATSCAAIWFRATTEEDDRFSDNYRVSVCPTAVSLTSSIDGRETVVASTDRPTSIGTAHELRLTADDREATLTVDGAPALKGPLTESSLISGQVLFGVVARPGGRADVTFAEARLRSGATTGFPAVPAFTSGDAQFSAGIWLMYDAGHISIVEPTDYLPGAEYCRRRGLPATSPACVEKTVPIPSSSQVAVPIARKPTYLDYRPDRAKCLDPATHAGTCTVPFGDFVTDIGPSPFAALVTIRGGEVVRVARMAVSSGN